MELDVVEAALREADEAAAAEGDPCDSIIGRCYMKDGELIDAATGNSLGIALAEDDYSEEPQEDGEEDDDDEDKSDPETWNDDDFLSALSMLTKASKILGDVASKRVKGCAILKHCSDSLQTEIEEFLDRYTPEFDE